MTPEKEDAFRKVVGKHGGPMNAYLLPYLNAIADGLLTMVPHFPAPERKKDAAA